MHLCVYMYIYIYIYISIHVSYVDIYIFHPVICVYVSLPESKKTVRLRHRDFPRPCNAATLTSQEAWQEGAMEGKTNMGHEQNPRNTSGNVT